MITEEQRKERIKYLGSSDAAAILGLSRWKTPLQVWAEKTGQVVSESSGSLAAEIGTELEDLCAKLFERRTGKKTHRVKETVYHPNYGFIAANLDRRVVGEDALLECKTTGAWAAKEWAGDDGEVPQEVVIQVQHQLAVTGKALGYACVLIGGNQDFIIKEVKRDNAVIKDMIQREAEFWVQYVEPKIMPTIVTPNDSAILTTLFPNGDDGDALTLGQEADDAMEAIEDLQGEIEERQETIDTLKNRLRLMLGEKTYGKTARFKVSWKNQKRAAFMVKESSSRVLRFNKIQPPKTKTPKENN